VAETRSNGVPSRSRATLPKQLSLACRSQFKGLSVSKSSSRDEAWTRIAALLLCHFIGRLDNQVFQKKIGICR
jgi:hypothetical protein